MARSAAHTWLRLADGGRIVCQNPQARCDLAYVVPAHFIKETIELLPERTESSEEK